MSTQIARADAPDPDVVEETPSDALPALALVARFGTFYFVAPEDARPAAILKTVVAALEEDPRVTSVADHTYEPSFTRRMTVWPHNQNAHDDELVTGADGLNVLRFSNALEFTIKVPKKNQPTFYAEDVVPSERYIVFWNGASMVVTWAQPADSVVRRAGGHVAIDIIKTATKRAGGNVYVQACSPPCRHLFNHTNLFVQRGEVARFEYEQIFDRDFGVVAPDWITPEELPVALYEELRPMVELFGEMKFLGQRVLDLEGAARHEVDHLNGILYARAHARQQPIVDRLKRLWTLRHWRRTARTHLSRLWLLLANVESVQRLWAKAERRFDTEGDNARQTEIFAGDHSHDDVLVETLDLSLVRAVAEESSGQLDNSAITLATAAGAAAAAVGAVVAIILS
jgi:hypothetical protein